MVYIGKEIHVTDIHKDGPLLESKENVCVFFMCFLRVFWGFFSCVFHVDRLGLGLGLGLG